MSLALTLSPLLAAPSSIDWNTSEQFALAANAVEKQCYTNALRAMNPAMQYVEGFFVGSEFLLPFEHGWLECEGTIVDPTLTLIDSCRRQEWRHFGAFRWSYKQVCTLFTDHNGSVSTPLQRYLPFWGKDEESWLSATLSAHRHLAAASEQRYGKRVNNSVEEHDMLRGLIGDRWLAKITGVSFATRR